MPETTTVEPRVILVTGLSGSGKSIALNVLEDGGYYCVDNLPANMLGPIVLQLRERGYLLIAVSTDARSGDNLNLLPKQIEELRAGGLDLRVLFLQAKTETLIKRYSETRRRHPLSDGRRTVIECIESERRLLADLDDLGYRIDTSDLNPNALRAWIKDLVQIDRARISLLFESFGFKQGIPLDADLVFDLRCIPNPHYDPNLRHLTGRDAPVIAFLERDATAQAMYGDIRAYLERWLPCFIRDNRSYVTVALGCTGGQHRSVYFAEKLADAFRGEVQVMVRHRELPLVLPSHVLVSV
jgi:UPF0042 nucleotide-binding protein